MTIPLDKLLLNRFARLPVKDSRNYLTSVDDSNDDHHFKYLGSISRCPWGSSGFFTHTCKVEDSVKYRTSALKSSSIHFVIDSSLIVPKGTKVNQCSVRIGPHILQNIDSWFVFLIYTFYRRGLTISSDETKTILPCPFYYTESNVKALPIFMGQQLGVHYEFNISSIPEGREVKLVNEYSMSPIETNIDGTKSISQHVPWFRTITVDVNEKLRHEIPLSSEDKIIRAIYFRVYNEESEDLEIISHIEIKPDIGEIEPLMCRKDFKNRYNSSISLPYYVYPLCVDPKSKVPGYGEVFKDEILIIELNNVGENRKIDVVLESIDTVVWMSDK